MKARILTKFQLSGIGSSDLWSLICDTGGVRKEHDREIEMGADADQRG
jgi:hypothetical protein